MDRETIFLVDGNSYIYRAYHAIRNLSNSKGMPTNAVFGFTKMLLKLFDEKKPKYAAVALDAKGPTFRHKLYDKYKATRPPMPDELVVQLPFIRDVISGLNIRMIEVPGYEADDIIGTLARIGEESGFEIVVITGDKDFRQIVSGSISLWDTMRDRYTDYASFKKEFQMEPEGIIDLMGLAGDSSDNIPGVKGVGEKTAMGLIKEYGTLENVYDHLDEIRKSKLKENLQDCHSDALISKKLVTIDRYVPLDESIDRLKVGEPQEEILADLFRDMEFKGLWHRFASGEDSSKNQYRMCISEEDIRSLIIDIKKAGKVSIDTETTSEDPHKARLVGISFSFKEGEACYLPLGHMYLGAPRQMNPEGAIKILKPILEDEKILKIGQNIKYDALIFRYLGVELRGIYFDTMIASYVINPGLQQHNLDYLAQHYLNHKMISYHDVVGKGKAEVNFSEVNLERATEYSCEDADITLRLMSILDKRLRQDMNQDLFYNMEMKLLPVLMDMEFAGIEIDVPFFKRMSSLFNTRIKDIQEKIYQEAGMEFNINSPKQLGFVLFEKLNLPVQKKTAKTKSYSTDVRVLTKLSQMEFTIPKLILQFRTLTKLKSTYLDALVKIVNKNTGRIHTSFNQTVTATGRLSSSNPNLQNIPIRGEEGREIRKGFVSQEGHRLLSADYSQVELRIFAHYSGDDALIDAFRKNEDIHSRTASEILGLKPDEVSQESRRIAKAINFGIIYGMGARKLSDELGIEYKEAKEYIESYYGRYKGVTRYRDNMIQTAREKGYITTLLNRRRYVPEIESKNNRVRSEAERIAVNTPIQGTAADLIKMAMINLHGRLQKDGFKTRILLQVHDELLFEVPDDELEAIEPVIRREMEEVYELSVPLKVDIHFGHNWGQAH